MSHVHPGAERHRVSRRGALAGGVAILAAGAGGAALGLRAPVFRPVPPHPPDVLLAAIAREQALIAALDAAAPDTTASSTLHAALRADHVEHLAALNAQLPPSTTGSPSAPTASPSTTTSTSAATVLAGERAAATASAAASASSAGAFAALLASIAACESGHVALLT